VGPVNLTDICSSYHSKVCTKAERQVDGICSLISYCPAKVHKPRVRFPNPRPCYRNTSLGVQTMEYVSRFVISRVNSGARCIDAERAIVRPAAHKWTSTDRSPGIESGFTQHDDLPFVHFARPLGSDPSGTELLSIYKELYSAAKEAVNTFIATGSEDFALHPDSGGDSPISYNLAMTTSGMAILPRRSEGTMLQRNDGSEIGWVALNGTTLGGTMMVSRKDTYTCDIGQTLTRFQLQRSSTKKNGTCYANAPQCSTIFLHRSDFQSLIRQRSRRASNITDMQR
jgi:hypothetical protein